MEEHCLCRGSSKTLLYPELECESFKLEMEICTAIGGNHLIHGCRRNIDLKVIVFNNNIYGMTGGQCSPTTPLNARTTTSETGNMC